MAGELMGETTIDEILASTSTPEDNAELFAPSELVEQGTDSPVLSVEEDDDFIVEVVDDRPEEDRVAPRDESRASESDFDDETRDDQVDDETNVDRIKRARYEYHEQRREAEAADRQREEAIKFAESVREENLRLRELLNKGETVLVEEVRHRTKSDFEKARQELAAAHENGDAQIIIDAQENFNRASYDLRQAELYEPQVHEEPVQQVAQHETAAPQTVDPQFDEWRSRNSWFDTDVNMRNAAIVKHNMLMESGVVPQGEAYYNQIDDFMVTNFPDKFRRVDEVDTKATEEPAAEGERKPAATQPASRVAPGSRTPGKKRVLRLSESEQRTARRLGLTNKQYALEKERLNAGGGSQ